MKMFSVFTSIILVLVPLSFAAPANVSQLNEKLERMETDLTDLRHHHYTSMIEKVIAISSPRLFATWKTISFPNAYAMESFYIRSSGWKYQQQYLVLTSRGRNQLSVYRLTSVGVSRVQTLDIPGAYSSKAIYIDNVVHLVVASCCDEEGSINHFSRLYSWDGTKLVFKQSIDSWFAEDASVVYTRNNDILLSFSTQDDQCSTHIYKWNTTAQLFERFQKLNINKTSKLHFFYTTPQQLWLSIASSGREHSYVYKWNGGSFELFQLIPSRQTKDLYPLVTGNDVYLIGAHFAHNQNAIVYKLNATGNRFESFQTLKTKRGASVDYFTIKNEHFVSIATPYNTDGENSQAQSVIYKFDGSTFETFQEISSPSAFNLKAFPTLSGCQILGVMSETSSQVSIYKWRDTSHDSMCLQ